MFCPKCGTTLSGNEEFCPKCGNNIKNVLNSLSNDDKQALNGSETFTDKLSKKSNSFVKPIIEKIKTHKKTWFFI